jgi:hypothetical protein
MSDLSNGDGRILVTRCSPRHLAAQALLAALIEVYPKIAEFSIRNRLESY